MSDSAQNDKVSGRTISANNLKQIVLALQDYQDSLRTFPPGRIGCDCTGIYDVDFCKMAPSPSGGGLG